MLCPFDIQGKNSIPFEVEDTFNKGNTLSGYLYRNPDLKYGMLYIERVNNKKCPQIVWATPKLHYPFDVSGVYRYPTNIERIEVYEKLDGTNVLAYSYVDKDCNPYVTYKTRLTPMIRDGSFGTFASMWKEMLNRYPNIPEMVLKTGHNLSFEMYGRRNKHLMEYNNSLDAVFLFGRDMNGVIRPPTAFDVDAYGISMAPLITIFEGDFNFIEKYQEIVDYLNEHIRVEIRELENDLVYGMEGSVWYGLKADGSILYKCKPDYVRDIHFAASEGIPHHSILTTCINAFEDRDDPGLDYIVELLKEEFSETDIQRKILKVSKILDEVRIELRLKSELREEYLKHPEFDINVDKGIVMRHFGVMYPKRMMSRIYNCLMMEFGKDDS